MDHQVQQLHLTKLMQSQLIKVCLQPGSEIMQTAVVLSCVDFFTVTESDKQQLCEGVRHLQDSHYSADCQHLVQNQVQT